MFMLVDAGYYSLPAFAIVNTLTSLPFLPVIAVLSSIAVFSSRAST